MLMNLAYSTGLGVGAWNFQRLRPGELFQKKKRTTTNATGGAHPTLRRRHGWRSTRWKRRENYSHCIANFAFHDPDRIGDFWTEQLEMKSKSQTNKKTLSKLF